MRNELRRTGAMTHTSLPWLAALMLSTLMVAAQPQPTAAPVGDSRDLLIADFEQASYNNWKVTGTAFGTGPARGTLPNQMEVEGYQGRGLVNSFLGGDDAKGRLTSTPFKLERKFITFLIGGGGWVNETCLSLIVDGQVVRTATGLNTQPGGSERLSPAAWDVAEFAGRLATIEIVDMRAGGWGHINVDHILLTDDRGSIPLAPKPKPPPSELTRLVRVKEDYLQLPLLDRSDGRQAGIERFSVEMDGKVVRFVHLRFAARDQEPDFIYSYDVREFRGREVTLRFKSDDTNVLDRLEFSNQQALDPKAYDGPLRPRFHFSPRRGWMNDVNGSYYQDGLYHIFYQANPTTAGRSTGFDMHWGHSVSKDLVHWEEWPVALFPDASGQCYSGTAVLAQHAIPGLTDKSALPTPVLFFAATTPFSQHIATTPDGGRTWQRYAGNPVVPNIGSGDRDPKVFWHEASQHYVMVLYVDGKGYLFLRSKDLLKWEQVSELANWFECPEFVPMKSPSTGEALWLLYGNYRSPKSEPDGFSASSAYQLGRFDGKTFTPVTPPRRAHQGPNFYAALTFVNEPKGRPIMMGWTSGPDFPGEPFNQCASLPLLLSFKAIAGQDTLCFEPAAEVNALRDQPLLKLVNCSATDATARLQSLAKDTPVDITVKFRADAPGRVTFRMREFALGYDPATKTITRGNQTTQIHPGKSLEARFLIDTSFVESFWNEGEAAYAVFSRHTQKGPAFAIEGDASIEELVVYPMKDIWK
jgi:fructan beta-fructosidase